MLPFWSLEFGVGSKIFGKFGDSYVYTLRFWNVCVDGDIINMIKIHIQELQSL